MQLKLTDYSGKPFVGSTVVAIYDKSVEYISGGSNVPEIKEFFWKWRRSHNPVTESNLGGYFGNIVPPNTQPMNDLGVFGGSVADDQPECDRGMMTASTERCRPTGARAGLAAAERMAEDGMMKTAAADGRRRADAHGRHGPHGQRRRWPRAVRWPAFPCRRQTQAAPAPARGPPGPAHAPHQVRRHGPLGRPAHDRKQRHGRGRAEHARKPHHLADQGLGHGLWHPRGPGPDRRRHPQGPDHSPGGPAVLRADRRSRALGRRA